jgi:hypothetical protein
VTEYEEYSLLPQGYCLEGLEPKEAIAQYKDILTDFEKLEIEQY